MAEIAILPEEQQVDALLHFFTTVLHEMPTDEIRRKRDDLMDRFSNCGCSYETCATLLELVDYHVARREQFAAREEAEARRAAKNMRESNGAEPIAFEPITGQPARRDAANNSITR